MNSFIFVCQSGLIECQSLLLAMSLRKHVSPSDELIAAFPEQFGELHPFTLSVLKSLDVRLEVIRNDFDPVYPCGNKMFAANLPFRGDRAVFLDSDLICVRSPRGELESHPISAIATGRFDVITHREWRKCHEVVGLEFKTNFQHVRAPIVVYEDAEFSRKWLRNAKVVYNGVALRKVRQVDQISLALTIQQMNGHLYDWANNPLMLSPSEVYTFNDSPQSPMPIFLVLQKGWLHYKRQGHPAIKSENPNSLAYYDDIRGLIYSLLAEHPVVDRIPHWKMIHDLYFSQEPLDSKTMNQYLRGVEGNQK